MSHDFDDDILHPRASRPPSGPVMVRKGGAALAGVRVAMVALAVSSAACGGGDSGGGNSQMTSNINGKTPTTGKDPAGMAHGAGDEGKTPGSHGGDGDGNGDSDAGIIAPMPAGDGDNGGDGDIIAPMPPPVDAGGIIAPMPPPVDAGHVIPDAGIIVVPPMPPPPMPEP